MTRLFAVAAGLIAWAVQFTVIYGVAAIACARGYGDASIAGVGLVHSAIVGATLLALAVTAAILVMALRDRRNRNADTHPTDRFLADTTLAISALSLVAIFWQGLPALFVPACA
jgi:hypothetical protein